MSVVAKPLIDLNCACMNGYKILKCFRKEKRVSGELPCPVTIILIDSVKVELLKNNILVKITSKTDDK